MSRVIVVFISSSTHTHARRSWKVIWVGGFCFLFALRLDYIRLRLAPSFLAVYTPRGGWALIDYPVISRCLLQPMCVVLCSLCLESFFPLGWTGTLFFSLSKLIPVLTSIIYFLLLRILQLSPFPSASLPFSGHGKGSSLRRQNKKQSHQVLRREALYTMFYFGPVAMHPPSSSTQMIYDPPLRPPKGNQSFRKGNDEKYYSKKWKEGWMDRKERRERESVRGKLT